MSFTTNKGMCATDWVEGCEHCWPDDAKDAWTGRSGLREIAAWVDESHFTLRGLVCPHCTCRFVSIFTETVDWHNGDDAQSWTMIPVTADEFERVASTLKSSVEAALRMVPSTRRSLRRDYPTGGEPYLFWASGISA